MSKSQSRDFWKERVLQLVRTIGFVWRSSRPLTLANAVLMILQGLMPLAGLYLMKLVIDEVTRSIAAPDKTTALWRVLFLIALTGGVFLFGTLCNALANLVRQAQAEVVSDFMHDLLHAKSMELDLQYYENPEYYDTLHRTKRDATFRPTRIVNGFMEMGQNGISLLAIIGLLFSLHWAIPVSLFLATLPGVFLRLFYVNRMHEWQVQRTALERRANYWHTLLLDEIYAKEIRLFNLGRLFKDRYHDVRRRLRSEKLRINTKQSLGELITIVGGTLAVFGSYAYIAYCAVNGLLSLGDLVMYLGAFQRGQAFLQSLLTGSMGLYEDNLFLATFYKFIDFKRNVAEPLHAKPLPRPLKKGITFDRVSFHYPNMEPNVLEEINIEIGAGETIGLVGENGSGKTTLVKLLCRFYDPTNGRILMDGTDLRDFDTGTLRSQISVVFQDYRRYYTTVRENIWLGDIGRPLDDERIIQAAKYSDIHRTVKRLKEGYDTQMGKWLENGEELSFGQLQKLAVARGLFRDGQVMILDEPTSAMDAKSEFEVFKRFQEMARGRTIILISHRLSTLRMADSIYVMKEGRIVERGSHQDLIRQGGTYADLFEIQARAYR